MAELADNLGPPGVFADANIAFLVELHRYRDVQGPKKWLGMGFSAAIDIGLPAIIGSIGGVAGTAFGAAGGAGEGTVVEPGGGTVVGAVGGAGVGRIAGIGAGGAIGGVISEAANRYISSRFFGTDSG